jgi:hypothetical protein
MRSACLALVLLLGSIACQAKQKKTCSRSFWDDTIQRDLHVFHVITREQLQAGEKLVDGAWHFIIKNNTLYHRPVKHAPVVHHGMVQLLVRAMCRYDMPDVEFLMFDNDIKRHNAYWPHLYIMFSNTKDLNLDLDFLVPYQSFMNFDEAGLATAPPNVPWANKTDKAVWRGSTTGGVFTLKNWRYKPRSKLVSLCKNHTSHCDAGFVNVQVQAFKDASQDMSAKLGVISRISMDAMSR